MRNSARVVLGVMCALAGASHVLTATVPRLAEVCWLPGAELRWLPGDDVLWQTAAGWVLLVASAWLGLSVVMTGPARDWAPAAVVGVMGVWGAVALAGWIAQILRGSDTGYWVYAVHYLTISAAMAVAIIGPRSNAVDAMTAPPHDAPSETSGRGSS